jgi:hypothetical protein
MDRVCWGENLSESEYRKRMENEVTRFVQACHAHSVPAPTSGTPEPTDASRMAQIMIGYLPHLSTFRQETDFIGPHDLNLLEQLITFITNLQHAPSLTQPNIAGQIPVYYQRLFLPIKEQIEKQTTPSRAPAGAGVPMSNSMQTMVPPTPPPPPQKPQRLPAPAPVQHPPPPPPTPPPPLPPSPQAAPPVQQQQTTQLEREAQLRKLFVSVRTDCAVFYSTPHPPHF